MERLISHSRRGERGFALLLVLVLLLVGALIITPLLSFMNTGLSAGKNQEQIMARMYAADAGIEDGMWQILDRNQNLPVDSDPPWAYNIPNVNSCQVDVTMAYLNGEIYKIESVATSQEGDTTIIKSYVENWGIDFLLGNAITSGADVNLSTGVTVNGDVWLNGTLFNAGTINGNITNQPLPWWPVSELMEQFFSKHINTAPVVGDSTINLQGWTMDNPYPLGPLKVNGGLKIKGDGYARLDGPVVTSGDVNLQEGAKLMLNNQALFSRDEISIAPNSSVSEPGSIISLNKLEFQPNNNSSPYLFLISLESYVSIRFAGGDIYGSVAGNTDVAALHGVAFIWSERPPGLNLPDAADIRVISWQYK